MAINMFCLLLGITSKITENSRKFSILDGKLSPGRPVAC